jgi:hypothetical protein
LRSYSVKSAAEQVLKLLPFAGDKPIPGAAIRSAGFRLIPADGPSKPAATGADE